MSLRAAQGSAIAHWVRADGALLEVGFAPDGVEGSEGDDLGVGLGEGILLSEESDERRQAPRPHLADVPRGQIKLAPLYGSVWFIQFCMKSR